MAEEHYSFPTNNPVLLISDPTQSSNFGEESISPKASTSAATAYHKIHNKKYTNTTQSPTSHHMSHHYRRRGSNQSSSDSDSTSSTNNTSPISSNDAQRWLKYQTDLSPVKTPKPADPAQMPSPIEEAVDSDTLSGDNGEADVPKIAAPYTVPKGSVPFIASIVYFKKRRTVSSGIATIPENEVFCNGADGGSDNNTSDEHEFSDKDVITKTELDALRCKFGNIILHHHHHGRHKLDPRRTKSLPHLKPLGDSAQEIKKHNLHLNTAAKTVKEALSCYKFGSSDNGDNHHREKPQISPSVSPLTEEATIKAVPSRVSENSNDEISSETDESLFDRVLASDNYGINNTDDDAFSQLEHRIDHQRRMSSSWFDEEVKANKSHMGGSKPPPFDSDHNVLKVPQRDTHNHHDHHQHGSHHHRNHHHHHHHITTPNDEEASRQLSPSSTITEHATSGAGTDDESTSGTASKCTQKRGKHQRRLTCAMVFTKPKVVEI